MSSRRTVISRACTSCRKRKGKCDGKRPVCSYCLRVGKESGCRYDEESDGRKVPHKVLNRILTRRLEVFDDLMARIKLGGDSAEQAIQEIRQDNISLPDQKTHDDQKHEDRQGVVLPHYDWEEEDSQLVTLDGKVHFFGGTSNLPEIKQNLRMLPGPSFRSSVLKSDGVTSGVIPEQLVEYLLELYFCWQHTYYNIFDMNLFLDDLRRGGKKYCSSFLLNAILAHACHLCDDQILQSQNCNEQMFYTEAINMLEDELAKQSLTTIQGLLLLASREAGIGRDSVGWVYSGMAFRMALDMGLHLDSKGLVDSGLLSVEDCRARNATLWGCYLFDQGWSTYMGRPPVIQMSIITSAKLTYLPNEEPVKWVPVSSQMDRGAYLLHYPHNTLTAIVGLSEIIEEIIAHLYSPKLRLTKPMEYFEDQVGKMLSKLISWESQLPAGLKDQKHPSAIMLYTLYNALRIFLFRPFIRMERIANIAPLEVCLISTGKVVEYLRSYKSLYTFAMATNLAVYTTFTAATVLLSAMKQSGEPPDDRLAQCLDVLDELGQSWPSAKRASDGIRAEISKEELVSTEIPPFTPTHPMGSFTDFFDLFNFDYLEFEQQT